MFNFLKRRYRDRRRQGVSEVEAAVLTIAITLIAGAALFGYVNDEAATSERQYGAAVGGTVNFLNENFVVVDMAVTPGSSSVTLVIYNNGQEALNISSILLKNNELASSGDSLDVTYAHNVFASTNNVGCGSVDGGSVSGSATVTINSNPYPLGSATVPPEGNPVTFTLALPVGCTIAQAPPANPTTITYYATVTGVQGNVVTDYAVN